MSPRRFTCLIISWLILPGSGVFPAFGQDADPSIQDELKIIQTKFRDVQSMYSQCVIDKQIGLLKTTLESKGELWFQRPGRIRWEITEPYQSMLIHDGQDIAQFEKVGGQWKKLDMGIKEPMRRIIEEIALMMEGRYAERQDSYDFKLTKSERPQLILHPRSAMARRFLTSIEIIFEPDYEGTHRIVMHEPDKDYTDITFRNQKTNIEIPAGLFDLNSPAPTSARVSRP